MNRYLIRRESTDILTFSYCVIAGGSLMWTLQSEATHFSYEAAINIIKQLGFKVDLIEVEKIVFGTIVFFFL